MGRNRLAHKVGRAVRRPGIVWVYLRRRLRNRRLRSRHRDHVSFYRAVMADDVARRSALAAVGTPTEERWLAIGKMQFRYMTEHGLDPGHRLLEIGCGNLRAGWRFIDYLDPGGYVGVDISPDILLAAERTVAERGLQEKLPRLFLIDGTGLDFLPEGHFDAVHAHSVFSHCPIDVVEASMRSALRVMRPGAWFDFTYNESDEGEWGFLDEDFYYPTTTLLALGERIGFDAKPMEDWHYKQAKIRLVKPAAGDS